ncbi:hypothetical protein K490DRAFT_58226 [Saccharata proteae CBS 121410]|uniref:Tachykinin family protein n=1 Tax=Saccharata proteae CBS 121410 TaxID=1314787 RepID=A0A9P4HQ88_9PEZI|nr:hypothetical protein K490DRAFT_58226 [Saccharata proteae CBS 121410]
MTTNTMATPNVRDVSAPASNKVDFQFLTTSNPGEFKNARFLKQIRSHAMLHYRNKEQHPDVNAKTQLPSRPKQIRDKDEDEKIEKNIRQPKLKDGRNAGKQIKFVAQKPGNTKFKVTRKKKAVPGAGEQHKSVKKSSMKMVLSESGWKAYSVVQSTNALFGSNAPQFLPSELLSKKLPKTHLSKQGSGDDEMSCMPQFTDPKVNIWDLKRRFDVAFVNEVMRTLWFPAMEGCRHAFLSTACIKSTYADVLDGMVNESPLTMTIKAEVIRLINESMARPETQANDGMLITIAQLMCSEIVQGDERVLHIHEKGLERIVQQRGSLDEVGAQGLISCIVTAMVFISGSLRESQPPSSFLDYLYHDTPVKVSTRLPESPIYCPRRDFYTINNLCSAPTLRILRDMRDLTAVFLSGVDLEVPCADFVNANITDLSATKHDRQSLQVRIWNVYKNTWTLPTAADWRSNPRDWVHESCRLTALLYPYALLNRLPFSVAARQLEGAPMPPIVEGSDFGAAHPYAAHPSVAIHTALQHTDLRDCWGDMIGVLLWITLVGATAARQTPSALAASKAMIKPGTAGHPNSYDAYRRREFAFARKSLAMIALRCIVRLGFERSSSVLAAQRTFLKVQERLVQK